VASSTIIVELLNFTAALWDSYSCFRSDTLNMRRSSTMRLVMAATGALALWLLSSSIADAAPVRRHHARSPRIAWAAGAESRPFTRAQFLRRTLAVHRHIVAKLQRSRAKALTDYDEGIQNTAAVGGEGELRLITVLEPIGMLAVPHCQLTSHRTVSRRTPRGPPTSPA
jgi:hypothetical protein